MVPTEPNGSQLAESRAGSAQMINSVSFSADPESIGGSWSYAHAFSDCFNGTRPFSGWHSVVSDYNVGGTMGFFPSMDIMDYSNSPNTIPEINISPASTLPAPILETKAHQVTLDNSRPADFLAIRKTRGEPFISFLIAQELTYA